MKEIDKMSKEAQELIRLCGSEDGLVGDVSAVIGNHPELLPGLNEYVAYVKEKGETIAEKKEVSVIDHKKLRLLREIQSQDKT